MARSVTEIDADLTAAYLARRNAMLAQSSMLDTGQGRQQVTRADLLSINRTIKDLEAEKGEAMAIGDGIDGAVSVRLNR